MRTNHLAELIELLEVASAVASSVVVRENVVAALQLAKAIREEESAVEAALIADGEITDAEIEALFAE